MKLTTRFKPLWMAVAFLFLWLLSPPSVRADMPTKDRMSKLDQPLAQVLEELGEKYQVFFSYNADLISTVSVDFTYKKGESLNLAMERLLTKTNFTYETYGEKYFVVFEKTKKGMRDAKKLKRNVKRIHKLENKGNLNISPQSGKTLNTIKKTANYLITKTLEKNLSGTVKDEEGNPLIGATIRAEGTTKGGLTNENGEFNLTVPDNVNILIISYFGYNTQEVTIGSQTTFDIKLVEGNTNVDEVVITALGLSREKRSLGYSVSQVDGEEISRVKSTNPLQALRGKVAGVNISNNAAGIKGSTRVIIRGNSSFDGGNQPLYIIDGISLQNQQLGSAGEWGGVDNGDGLSALNPDDIKSISVLKGGAAAALYGSRASNGVIIIKTKDGSSGPKGLGIEINNQTVFTSINGLYDPQTTYGNGVAGGLPTNQKDVFNSWGPKLDGSSRVTYDGTNQPYSYAGNNMERLYSTGLNMTNSVAFTSNTAKGNTRVSATQINGTDVVETSKLKRQSFNINTAQQLSTKLNVNASVKFSDTREDASPIVATAPMSPNGTIRYFAPNINVNDFLGDFGNGTIDGENELVATSNIFSTNPWFAVHNNITSADRERLLGAINMRYDLTDFLFIRGQAGIDKATNHFNNQILNGAPLFQPGVAYNSKGQLFEQTQTIDQYDADLFIGTDKLNITEDFAVDGFIGVGTFSFASEAVGVFGNQTVIPQLYTVLNTENQSGLYGYQAKKINSVYGSAQFSFADKIYLSVTARNDWFSTLSATGKEAPNNDLYGSASLSLILSDLMDLPEAISFAKLRGGYSQVAGGANNPYGLNLTYSLIGQGHLGNPLGAINGGTIPNTAITPYQKNETEVGLDLRLFKNRIGLDIAYYSNETLGDIVAATTSIASGFNNTTINLGEISNKGVELLLRGTIIDKSDLSLDVTFNYTNNQSEVVRTDEDNGIIQAGTAALFQSFIGHIPGQPYGVIYGSSYVRDDQGRIVHEMNNGIPVPKSEAINKVLGLGVAPTQVGFGTNLRYKGFNLNAFFEGKFGGTIVSGTNQSMKQYGLHKVTVPEGGREAGFVPDGVLEDGSVITQTLTDGEIYHYWTASNKFAIGEENAYKNDFIRISQLSLGYQIPKNALENTPIRGASVSLVGNNLGFIFNNVPNIDPEAYYNTRNAQGVEGIAMPIGRSIGFSVNIKL